MITFLLFLFSPFGHVVVLFCNTFRWCTPKQTSPLWKIYEQYWKSAAYYHDSHESYTCLSFVPWSSEEDYLCQNCPCTSTSSYQPWYHAKWPVEKIIQPLVFLSRWITKVFYKYFFRFRDTIRWESAYSFLHCDYIFFGHSPKARTLNLLSPK